MSCNNKKNKKLAKKELKKNCKVNQNCNTSDLTDSVEFANEPFDNNVNKKKCSNNKRNNKC